MQFDCAAFFGMGCGYSYILSNIFLTLNFFMLQESQFCLKGMHSIAKNFNSSSYKIYNVVNSLLGDSPIFGGPGALPRCSDDNCGSDKETQQTMLICRKKCYSLVKTCQKTSITIKCMTIHEYVYPIRGKEKTLGRCLH